jgi:hypothetical protein
MSFYGEDYAGVLARSTDDLHPQHYRVLWNGTMDALAQKADQRQPPPIQKMRLSSHTVLELLEGRTMTRAELGEYFDATYGQLHGVVEKLQKAGLVHAYKGPSLLRDELGRERWCQYLTTRKVAA